MYGALDMEPIVVVMLSIWAIGGLVAATYVFNDKNEQYGPVWERLGAAALAGIASGGALVAVFFFVGWLAGAIF